MPIELQTIAAVLKAARTAKGLSQSALAERVGLPQSHISRIESGAVDLQASNLIQLARALDLEVSLVPRQVVPAVEALSATRKSGLGPVLSSYMHNLSLQAERAARRPGGSKLLQELRREIGWLHRLSLGPEKSKHLQDLAREISRVLKRLQDRKHGYPSVPVDEETKDHLSQLIRDLRMLTFTALHETTDARAPRPAHSLDDDTDDDGV
jgi:transcriptional regulator with XRE-family HTH domain